MTLGEQQQLAERAYNRLSLAYAAIFAARADLRAVGQRQTADECTRLIEPLARVAGYVEGEV